MPRRLLASPACPGPAPPLLPLLLFMVLLIIQAGAHVHFPDRGPHGWWPHGEWGQDDTEVQVVYLPTLLPREEQLSIDQPDRDYPLPYNFDAFGRSFELNLIPNRHLVSPNFRVWSDEGQEAPLSVADTSCHYQHSGPGAVAALSACRDHALHGLIVVDNSTYEVHPLPQGSGRRSEDADGDRTAHVIRRASPPPRPPRDDARPLRPRRRPHRLAYRRKPPPRPPHYTIETALFMDEAAYKIFSPLFDYNEADLRDMLLAYINGVQALYQHASLGTQIQLSLVRLTLLRSQPAKLPPHAERGRLLDAFCAYQRDLNVLDDDDPQHWDMALLLSGMDFYAEEGGRRNGVTMGLAPVGGVCLPAHACVVAEFGAGDALGRPYPSAGFTSVYILAHEIGHNLGMHHDGTGNTCARDGYIMSPSRGTSGEATWSQCSARAVADLQWATCLFDGADEGPAPEPLHHEKYNSAPGVLWGAKRQCEVLLRDVDAAPSPAAPAAQHCTQLACRSPHRAGFYYAGPALPGTLCGHGMWCQGGECVTSHSLASATVTEAPATSPGAAEGWAAWRDGSCRSGCTLRSRGARERRRSCLGEPSTCHGAGYDVVLCDDTKVCGKKSRLQASELAARKCGEYAARVPGLDARGGGLQAPHDPTRMWMGCAMFCRRASGGGFYAPRVELNDAGLDPYFPDGTWCHHDGLQDYYCLQHHCLPENFKMTAQYHIWELPGEDFGGPLNARARAAPEQDPALTAYHSLDDAGTPLLRSNLVPSLPEDNETYWEDVDYVEIKDLETVKGDS